MKKLVMLLVLVSLLTVALSSAVLADGHLNTAQFCKEEGRDLIAEALEIALLTAHEVEVDLKISQGACVSTIATHTSANGVNTTALATDFCKQVIEEYSVRECVEHVEPALLGIFHPSP